FATIVGAVREGRTIYENILKFVRFQLSTNIGALMTMFLAALLELPDPFTPIQILWVNIIMDGPPAMALGLEPTRPETMAEPPRKPGAQILTWPRLARVVFLGAVMVAGSLVMLVKARAPMGQPAALTMTFSAFVLFQVFNVFNARAERGSIVSPQFFHNRTLWFSVLGVCVLQVVAVQWGPAEEIFSTVPLSLAQWGWVVAMAASIVVLEELRKLGARLLAARTAAAPRALPASGARP
ncbi:MAG TPA: cation transporting ATPase C-terminal domain-containing protein, partial [bacterium]|nr:cation transporting ATPase C-terminal domain-containing protein [bacterium]